MKNIGSLVILIISSIALIALSTSLRYKKKRITQVQSVFSIILILMAIWTYSLILQILFQNTSLDPVLFEGFASFGACFVPVTFMLFSIVFAKTKIKFKPTMFLIYIIPVITTIIMLTNSHHHLMYQNYSLKINETTFGNYFPIHSMYSYICIGIGLIYLFKYIIKNAGFFSKQSLLIVFGALIPIVVNILGALGIVSLTVYATPISFTVAFVFFALAIFKFDFLKVAPIALQRIVDRISDAYIVVNEENVVTDFNQTFLDLFSVKGTDIRNKSLEELFDQYNDRLGIKKDLILESTLNAKLKPDTIVLEEPLPSIGKYFHIEINSIVNNRTFLGVLILLKDITQHMQDMETIRESQDMLVEKERLASLGQMIGGIAHNLKTPIMSIAGAAEGLSDLIKEYDSSIEDPEVTPKDHHEIAHDMNEWIEKVRTHLSYMSDVITAIKGQAVTFSEQTSTEFTIKELLNYIDILMRHELKNAIINLNTQADIDVSTVIHGNINSLVQVINNIISNAIQAYQSQGKTNEKIDFRIYAEGKNIVFKIEDHAGGLPDKVKDKLFKEMVTTKGKNGTGLGLFMSYSNIKAHFSGNLRYETEKGKGTTFYIEIPR